MLTSWFSTNFLNFLSCLLLSSVSYWQSWLAVDSQLETEKLLRLITTYNLIDTKYRQMAFWLPSDGAPISPNQWSFGTPEWWLPERDNPWSLLFSSRIIFHVPFTFLFPSKSKQTQFFLFFDTILECYRVVVIFIKLLRYDTVTLEKNIALKSNLPSKNLSNISIAWGKLLPSNWITIHHD